MDLSKDFKINLHRTAPEDAHIMLVEISHPLLTVPIRLCENSCEVVSGGFTYIPCAFDYGYQPDIEDEVPKASFSVTNIGKPIMKWIEQSVGAKDAQINFIQIREYDPDDRTESYPLEVLSCTVTLEKISFDLAVQNNHIIRGTRLIFDPTTSPGLY